MSMLDRLGAMTGSALVHAAAVFVFPVVFPGLVFAMPAGWVCLCTGPDLEQPVIAILDPAVHLGSVDQDGETEAGERCRPGAEIDSPAEPLFPLFQRRRLVARGPDAHSDPVVCARIGTAGEIGAAFLLRRSGDRGTDAATIAALRGLSFRPAQSEGRPRSAWHKIIVPLG